ncbi:hypothetical protein [Streptosporangium jomthongense]|uniref:Uncharacterized protein n=1 Tax=Streptosporangium jomthongense TaxID=1193683 RepID=A0ABV8FFK2_9ACTN
MILDAPTYQDEVPGHLRTLGQLRAAGLLSGNAAVPAAWWVQPFAGDLWRTELYDVRLAVSLVPQPALPAGPEPVRSEPVVMTIVT